uniref:C-type lectin domain-containing protein n=1 Tax=Steinernema glaseri TaxID=37863 RepID=A0A1I7ZNV6_9BILA
MLPFIVFLALTSAVSGLHCKTGLFPGINHQKCLDFAPITLSYEAAVATCTHYGGQIAMVATEDVEALRANIRSNSAFWINSSSEACQSLAESNSAFWINASSDACQSLTEYGIREVSCDSELYYICEYAPAEDHVEISTKICPCGWTDFNGHCYQAFTRKLIWNQAHAYCLMKGGDLASIHSSLENQFISGLLGANSTYWLGGIFLEKEKENAWIDGSDWDYGNVQLQGENYNVAMWKADGTSKWIGADGMEEFNFVCKQPVDVC